MKMRELGKSGLKVSEMGLGCMGMSSASGQPQEKAAMIQLIRKGVALGVTFFDTAEVYGPFVNEELVGEALAPYKNQVTIASKVGIKMVAGKQVVDGRPMAIRDAIEGTLRRLGVEALDLYYLHRVDPNVPIEEVALTMQGLQRAGKIKHWGLSEAGVQTIRRAHEVMPLAAVESEYSLWTREPEAELLPTLAELGIGFVPFSSLGKGFLTGAITSESTFKAGDGRNQLPRFSPEARRANQRLVDLIKEKAREKQATPAQIALAWLLAQQPWIVPIPGTTKPHRLVENLGATEVSFTPAELADFDRATKAIEIVGHRYTPELAKRVGL